MTKDINCSGARNHMSHLNQWQICSHILSVKVESASPVDSPHRAVMQKKYLSRAFIFMHSKIHTTLWCVLLCLITCVHFINQLGSRSIIITKQSTTKPRPNCVENCIYPWLAFRPGCVTLFIASPIPGLYFTMTWRKRHDYQITTNSTVCSTACPGKQQIKHYWPFVRGIHSSPMDSSHKGPVMRNNFPCHDVIMWPPVQDVWHLSLPRCSQRWPNVVPVTHTEWMVI